MAGTGPISRRHTLQGIGALGTAAMLGSAGSVPARASEGNRLARHRYERSDESGDCREGVPDAADRHARASDRGEGAARGDVASAGPGGRLEPAAEPLPQLRPARGGHAAGGVRPVLLDQRPTRRTSGGSWSRTGPPSRTPATARPCGSPCGSSTTWMTCPPRRSRRCRRATSRPAGPGFYRRILCEMGKIESCQVNCLGRPFGESDMPTLLMQDLSIVGMFSGPELRRLRQARPASRSARWPTGTA